VAVTVGKGVRAGVLDGVGEGWGACVAVDTGEGKTVGVLLSTQADKVHRSIINKKNRNLLLSIAIPTRNDWAEYIIPFEKST
jgi:hypothetical protein